MYEAAEVLSLTLCKMYAVYGVICKKCISRWDVRQEGETSTLGHLRLETGAGNRRAYYFQKVFRTDENMYQ